MERLREGGHWTLFDPADTADLATLCGARLAARYCYYEAQLEHATQVSTRDLWNEISAAQSRTSQPGIVFSCTLYSMLRSLLRPVQTALTSAYAQGRTTSVIWDLSVALMPT